MNIDDIRFKIAASRRILYREGCDSSVGGQVSARASDGSSFWVSPFEYFDETVPTTMVRVGINLEVLEGDAEVSPAVNFLAAVYEQRPDVMAIIHTHSHYASVVSTTGKPIGMYNHESCTFYNQQAFFEEDGGPPVSGKRIASALGDKRVMFLKNHGTLIASDSLEEATIEAIMLENASRYHFESLAIGGTECPDHEVQALFGLNRLLFIPKMWASNLRRLRKSDPDLFEYLTEEAGGDTKPNG